MARTEIDLVVQTVSPTTGRLSAAASKSVTVYARNADGSNGAASTVYQFSQAIAGPSDPIRANPLTSDSSGRIEGWVGQGNYNLVVSGTGITGYTQAWEAGSPNASTSVKGTSTLSVAPVSATAPVAVGDNDPRLSSIGATFISIVKWGTD